MKEYGVGCLAVLGIFLFSLAISFLCTAAIVWLLCWALPLVGITAIAGWTIAFSWKLVLIIAIILAILRSIFSAHVTVNK